MKTLEEKIAVMQAALEGKEIEDREIGKTEWRYIAEPNFNWGMCDYRIKPIQEYVPYESAEEFLQAQKEHGMYIYSHCAKNFCMLPNCVNNEGVFFEEKITYPYKISYAELLQYKWQDGTPCGKLK